MAFLLLALVRAFEEYPRPGAATVALVGLGAGLAIGTRILGGFGALYALGALALIVAIEARRDGLRAAGAACGRFVLRLLPGLLLGYAAMALVWPWSAAEPLNPFRALQYFSRFFEEPWDELFGGALIKVTADAAQLSADAAGAQAAGDCSSRSRSAASSARWSARSGAATIAEPARGAAAGRARGRAADRRSPWRCGRRCTTASGISCSWCRRSRSPAGLPARGCSTRCAAAATWRR